MWRYNLQNWTASWNDKIRKKNKESENATAFFGLQFQNTLEGLGCSISHILATALLRHTQPLTLPYVSRCQFAPIRKTFSLGALRCHTVQLMDGWKWSCTCGMGCIECHRQRQQHFPGYLQLFVCVPVCVCVGEKWGKTKEWEGVRGQEWERLQ